MEKKLKSNDLMSGPSRREFLWKAGATVSLLPVLGQVATTEPIIRDAEEAHASKPDSATELSSFSTSLTFDGVQQSGHEVSYEEIASLFAGPMSKHPVVSVKAHPEVIWVRPDMGIGMAAHPVAFGVGEQPRQVQWAEVRRSLQDGHLPIVTSRWQDGPLLHEQLAFATLLNAREVKTGHEKQLAMVQMAVTNTEISIDRHAVLWAFVPYAVAAKAVPPPPYDTYDLFEITGSLPGVSSEQSTVVDDVLHNDLVIVGTHSEDPAVRTTVYRKAVKFEMDLRPGETKSIRFAISSNAQGLTSKDIESLRAMDFLSARDRRALDLLAILSRGTQIQVPEEVVNNIYKAQILYNQPQMVQAADRDYYMPVQGYLGVWPWEAMKMLLPLDAIGYHQDVTKSLGYFPRLQSRFPPAGEINGERGFFSGTGSFQESGWENDPESTIYGIFAELNKGKWFPGWMNWTGAVLYAFGEHYFYSDDTECLRRSAPALVQACDWIISERRQTKQRDNQGQKAPHYGLMPAGEPYDLSEKDAKNSSYYFCFTDGYTCAGLTSVARALVSIGNPEGQRLLSEAAEYRKDILEVMTRTREIQADLPPYPDHLGLPASPGWADFACGALSLVDTGFIDPHEPAFLQLESYMKNNYNRGVLGLTGGLRKDGDHHAPNAYYVSFSEDIWQRAWMLRGEVEKSLLAFYSTLAFGVDKDTLGSVERFDLYDRRYAPFFMDASGSSRIIGMIRQALLMEEAGVLYLLAGAPRRWLEAGKKIEVKKGTTYFGNVNLSVESEVDEGRIQLSLELENHHPDRLKNVNVRIPHPRKEKIKEVTVNSKVWKTIATESENIVLKPTEASYQIVVHY